MITYWLCRTVALLPLPVKYGLSATIAFLLRHVFRYRAKVIDTNLRNAFPERDAEWRRYTTARFYRQFADVTMEIVHASRMNLADFKRRVTVEGIDELDRLTENRTRSVIVLTIHLGNWEWMMHAANAHGDISIDPVYKRLRNAGAERFAYEVRSQFGGEPILMEKQVGGAAKGSCSGFADESYRTCTGADLGAATGHAGGSGGARPWKLRSAGGREVAAAAE